MTSVFISYAHSDGADIAEWLYKRLEGAGFQAWKDNHSLPLGRPFVQEISRAIETHEYVLLVLSSDAVGSEWVEYEANLAEVARKHLIPIVVGPVDVPLRFKVRHYLHVLDKDGMKLHDLVNALGGESIPRIVNLSGRDDFQVANALILEDAAFNRVDLSDPKAIESYGIELANLALPYIRKADAGIIPPGSAPVASVALAYLLGEVNAMPRMYVPWPDEDRKFRVDGARSLSLQETRHKGFADRATP